MKLQGLILLAAIAPLSGIADSPPSPISPGIANGADADNQPDPAEPLLRVAALKSPVLLEQELRVAQADAFRFRGWRQYMPYINASWQAGSFTLLGSNDPAAKEGQSQFGGSFTLNANYPLYAWGAIEAEKKFTLARENLAKTNAVVAWRDLVKNIRSALLDAVVSKSTVALLEKRVEAGRRSAERTEQEFKLGKIVASERTSRMLKVRETELLLDQEKIRLAGLMTTLRGLTGDEDYSVAAIPSELAEIRWNDADLERRFAAFQKDVPDDVPEIRAAGYEREMYRQQRTMAEARDLPIFNLGASMAQTPIQTAGGFGMQTFVFAGITGSWNIFDRDTNRESVRAQIVGERLVESRMKFGGKRRSDELESLLRRLKSMRDSINLRLDLVKLRGEALELMAQRVKLGLAGPEDVNNAEIDLLDARLSLTRDRAEIQKTYHAFRSGVQLSPSDRFYTAPSNER